MSTLLLLPFAALAAAALVFFAGEAARRRRLERFLLTAERAPALVLGADPSGLAVDDGTGVVLHLEVHPRGERPFLAAAHTTGVPMRVPRRGAVLTVFFDPARPDEVVLG